jgi:outer membrane receptor protein involved in Fe transport
MPVAVAAQVPPVAAVAQVRAVQGELQGVVTDDRGEPLAGAVVSAFGTTTAFAVTDRAGRFAFQALPLGSYLVRAHLKGYVPPRAQMIQVAGTGRATSSIALARRAGPDDPPQILAAGMGGAAVQDEGGQPGAAADGDTGEDHPHTEPVWRLRHLKRSILKESDGGVIAAIDDDSFIEDSVETIGRAMEYSARVASSVITDLPLSGEVNFLTTRSFDQPQDLFSIDALPRGVAFISLNAPTTSGDWNVRGAMTQGDLASWVLAGSYVRRQPAAHQFEAGMLYSMQRYDHGNPASLAAVADGSRNAGEVYAYDRWTIGHGVMLHYGARYARYDYLEDDALFSPRIGVVLGPSEGVRLRLTASRRELAPGAEEFLPQSALGVWLPPERTFSPISSWRGFEAQRVHHYEIATEHDMAGGLVMGLRAFRQRVDDQMVTMFGLASPQRVAADIGHYYVASGGDLGARGFGLSLGRQLPGNIRGSIDYTRINADWRRPGADSRVVELVAPSAHRTEKEVVHDLTTSVETQIPATATRVYVLYKLSSGFSAPDVVNRSAGVGSRFDLQITQALPFLDFAAAHWEMLLNVRNLFREELLDASVYDELLVVKPPKRVVGGLTVRF